MEKQIQIKIKGLAVFLILVAFFSRVTPVFAQDISYNSYCLHGSYSDRNSSIYGESLFASCDDNGYQPYINSIVISYIFNAGDSIECVFTDIFESEQVGVVTITPSTAGLTQNYYYVQAPAGAYRVKLVLNIGPGQDAWVWLNKMNFSNGDVGIFGEPSGLPANGGTGGDGTGGGTGGDSTGGGTGGDGTGGGTGGDGTGGGTGGDGTGGGTGGDGTGGGTGGDGTGGGTGGDGTGGGTGGDGTGGGTGGDGTGGGTGGDGTGGGTGGDGTGGGTGGDGGTCGCGGACACGTQLAQIANKLDTIISNQEAMIAQLNAISDQFVLISDQLEQINAQLTILNDVIGSVSSISSINDYLQTPRTSSPLNTNKLGPAPTFDPTPPTIQDNGPTPYVYDKPIPQMPSYLGTPAQLPQNPEPFIMAHDAPATTDHPIEVAPPVSKQPGAATDVPLMPQSPLSQDSPMTQIPIQRDEPLQQDTLPPETPYLRQPPITPQPPIIQ